MKPSSYSLLKFVHLTSQLHHSFVVQPLLRKVLDPSWLKKQIEMWFSVVCTLIDNDTRHHSGQNVVGCRVSPQKNLTTAMMRIVFDKSTDHAKLHFNLFFFSLSTTAN